MHHSHATGKIIAFARDFCNQKVRETKDFYILFAHKFSDFDFFYVVESTRLCVWRTKNLCIGGSNLTNVNYANIGDQVKIIDTMKFY